MGTPEPYLQVGVKVVLSNEQGDILLLRRNPKKYPEVGPKWDIVGGRINIGENLLDNIKREIKEETSLELSSEPTLLYAQDILNVDGFPGRHVVRLTYKATVTGEPKIDEESLEYGWFSKDHIKSMDPNELDRYFRGVFDKGLL